MTEKNLSEITIHDVDPLALTLLVNFSYTGELSVCEDNVQVKLTPTLYEEIKRFVLFPENNFFVGNFFNAGSASRLLDPPDELREGGVLQVPHAAVASNKLPRHQELCGHTRLQGASQTLS